ncbi:MAG: hypothetical protein H7Y86_20075 [Rhizobacter sp.]|nr:hypothetical protein [Ferruginibacter sp.]
MNKRKIKLTSIQVIFLLVSSFVIFSFVGKRSEKNAAISSEKSNKINQLK